MQLQMLGLLFEDPRRGWTAHELRASLDAPASSIHRELQRAVEADLVVRHDAARPHSYRANTAHPLFEPIEMILERTVGVEAELRSMLQEIDGVDAALIHGSWASGNARAGSDVDVLVVGSVDYDDLVRQARVLGRRLGRRIDPLVFGPEEIRRRRDQGFIRKLLDGPRVVLVGDLDEVLGGA
jgi:predicted nucleotidyltransferase